MSKGIWVKVRGFENYKGRKDVIQNSWFRCSNRLLEDADFFDFTPAEILVWIYILSLTSQKNTDTVFVGFAHAERICRLKKSIVQSAIDKLLINQLLPVDVTSPDVDVTQTCATRQDKTDKTDKTECEPGGSLPPIGLVWNQSIKSLPKIKDWGTARARNSKPFLAKHTIEDWDTACQKVEASEFLSGRNGKWTSCSFDWLLNLKNFTKVIEGNYDNRVAPVTNGMASVWAEIDAERNSV